MEMRRTGTPVKKKRERKRRTKKKTEKKKTKTDNQICNLIPHHFEPLPPSLKT